MFVLLFLTVAVSTATESPCFKDPTRESCKDADTYYTTEMRRKDLKGLCTAMPEMSGCVVQTDCQQGKITSSKCEDWSLLHDICFGMMSRMADCTHFSQLCLNNNKTVVSQCTKTHGIKNLISGQEASKLSRDICAEMVMEQCPQCTEKSCPAPLRTLSDLCISMPHMKQCASWSHMCASNRGELQALCESPIMPGIDTCTQAPMNMLFHASLSDAILFEGLYACTPLSYLIAWLSIAVGSFCYEWLKCVKAQFLREIRAIQKVTVWTEILVLLFTTVLVMMGYVAMLIAMTFNIGYFFAVVIGLSIGKYVFAIRKAIRNLSAKDSEQLLGAKGNYGTAAVHHALSDDYNCCE